jgi:alanyl-tRNA synthetase
LGVKDLFFYRLVGALVGEMGAAYPALAKEQARIEKTLRDEEQQFARTLENGMLILDHAITGLSGKVIPGDTVFKLYDTFGFPVDLTADVAREHGLTLDMDGFDKAMEGQRQQARAASQFNAVEKLPIEAKLATKFVGYEHLQHQGKVLAIYQNSQSVDSLIGGADAVVLLDSSPFYGESGGQAGDKGILEIRQAGHVSTKFYVTDTQKQGEYVLHKGKLQQGGLKVGDTLNAEVDESTRRATMSNHSATHLLHAALRFVLGEHVTQKGSLVTADRLRFDFSHSASVSAVELQKIEKLVNTQVLTNLPVAKHIMSIDQAMQVGAMALFGEKYGDEVRVVSMGEFSTELCGGTHVERSGDIGLFKVVSESGIAAGVRRIEAVSGMGALAFVAKEEDVLRAVCDLLKTGEDNLFGKVQQLIDQQKSLEKSLDQIKSKLATAAGSDLAADAVDMGRFKLLSKKVEGFNSKTLRETVDQLKNKLGTAVVVLGMVEDGKVSLVAGVTQDLTDRIKAGDVVNHVALQVGGKGGGRPDMAMAGGTDADSLDSALGSVEDYVKNLT